MLMVTTILNLVNYAAEHYDMTTEEAREKAKELARRGQDAGLRYGQDWSEWLEGCDNEPATSAVVYGVKPHHSGFGMFQRSVEKTTYPGWDSVSDYVSHVIGENHLLRPITEGDEEYKQVGDADGKIYDQGNGTVIGWKDRDGNVSFELVYINQ